MVIISTDRYKQIYRKGAYSIHTVVVLYGDSTNKDKTRLEVHQAEGNHEAKRNDRSLYDKANSECKNFIMEVVDKTWYKELKNLDTFYMNVTDLKLLDHHTEFFSGFHAINAARIPQLTETLCADADGIPQFINTMEASQKKSKRVKLEVQDEYIHAVELKSLLK